MPQALTAMRSATCSSADPPTGNTHLAQSLGHEACRQGATVLFINTQRMLQHLAGGRAGHSFDRRLASYLRPDLLILDEFGLKPLGVLNPEIEKGRQRLS